MATKREIVITGVGMVSSIGIGKEPFWNALCDGRSGIRRISVPEVSGMPLPIGGDVADFDPKLYVRPRKSLKVMSREVQLGYTAADLACEDAGLTANPVDPERLGVIFGSDMIPCELPELSGAFEACSVDGRFDFSRWGEFAIPTMFPLWMLKYLPNMPACHIGIAKDARGPNNSIILGEVSSLSALIEATGVLDRGQADVLIAGATGSRLFPAMMVRMMTIGLSARSDTPTEACRPFDAGRDGLVVGEGAGAMVMETRESAQARGATPIARVRGYASAFEPIRKGQGLRGDAIRRAMAGALARAGLEAKDIGHVAANGLSTVADDAIEAEAIYAVLGDVPVTATKSYFGHLGAATGVLETVAAVLAVQHGQAPATLNYEKPDPRCPIRVIHGEPMTLERRTAMVIGFTRQGQAVAVILEGID